MIKDAWGKHTGLQASYKAAGTAQCVKQKALHRVTTLMVGLLGHLQLLVLSTPTHPCLTHCWSVDGH